jgi:hypothetical protein
MATAVLFLGWDRPVVGREPEAFKFLMGEGKDILGKFQKQGFFERAEQIALTPHCASLNGMLLLFGERAKLDELRRTDEFEHFSLKLMTLFEGYGVVPGLNGEGLERAMGRNKDLLSQ